MAERIEGAVGQGSTSRVAVLNLGAVPGDVRGNLRLAVGMLGLMTAVATTDYSLYRRLNKGTPGK